MKKRLTLTWAVILFAAVLGTGIVVARSAWQSSANYAIPWDVVAEGGGEMSSASYAVEGTIGQPAIGPISSSSYAIGGGYWYGIGDGSVEVYLPLIMK